jgi:hypothetical protein
MVFFYNTNGFMLCLIFGEKKFRGHRIYPGSVYTVARWLTPVHPDSVYPLAIQIRIIKKKAPAACVYIILHKLANLLREHAWT